MDKIKIKNEDRVEIVAEPKAKVKPVKMVTITFRENRAFELYVGHKYWRFEGRESKQIPVELLKTDAFKQASKYFSVKGV